MQLQAGIGILPKMNTYELTVVLAGSMPEAKRSAVIDKIKKAVAGSDGSITKTDEWGKRELAYKISHEKEAFYYLLELSLPPDRTGGFKRLIENDEQVARHLLVVKSKEKKTEEPKKEKVVDKKGKKKKIGKKK